MDIGKPLDDRKPYTESNYLALLDTLSAVNGRHGNTYPVYFSVGDDRYRMNAERFGNEVETVLQYLRIRDEITHYDTLGRWKTVDRGQVCEILGEYSGCLWREKPILIYNLSSFNGEDIVVGMTVGEMVTKLLELPQDAKVMVMVADTVAEVIPMTADHICIDEKGMLTLGIG